MNEYRPDWASYLGTGKKSGLDKLSEFNFGGGANYSDLNVQSPGYQLSDLYGSGGINTFKDSLSNSFTTGANKNIFGSLGNSLSKPASPFNVSFADATPLGGSKYDMTDLYGDKGVAGLKDGMQDSIASSIDIPKYGDSLNLGSDIPDMFKDKTTQPGFLDKANSFLGSDSFKNVLGAGELFMNWQGMNEKKRMNDQTLEGMRHNLAQSKKEAALDDKYRASYGA